MKEPQLNKKKLFYKISGFVKRENLLSISAVFLNSAVIFLLIILLISILEYLNYFSSKTRLIFFVSLIISFSLVFIFFSFRYVINYFSTSSDRLIKLGAKRIGKLFPNLRDNLLNSIQLLENKNINSQELITAALDKVYKQSSHINFLEKINYSEIKKTSRNFIIVFLSLITIFTFITPLRTAGVRLINFNSEFTKPFDFSLEVITGNKKIKKGENVSLEIKAKGIIPENIIISTKTTIDAEITEHIIKQDSTDTFFLELRNVKNSVTYFAKKNNVITDTYYVTVTTAPIISNLSYKITPPKYTRQPVIFQENNGNITALKGSKVNFNLTSTKNLKSAVRVTQNGIFDSLNISESKISGQMIVNKDSKYHFQLLDNENNYNENPIEYSIKMIPDNFPTIEIIRPEQISLIPANDIVSINHNVTDDYGFTKLKLKYSINKDDSSDNYNEIELAVDKKEIEQSLFYNWDVSRLGLKGNEIISYYLEVFDNDFISGPKSTKTSIYKLRVPTLDELFTQADDLQESAIEDLVKTVEDAKELKEELEQISNDMKQNEKEISWNEKERIEDSMKKFDEISSKIDNVQEKLENLRKNLAENNLLSEETMQKYNELQDLMDELNSDEMKKALENMQKSIENLMRDKVQQNLDNLSMNEEMFQKSIERTLNLLKKIQIEQKMDEVIKRTEEIVEDLNNLSKETENKENKNNTRNEELAEKQKNIENQLDNLGNEMNNLEQKMNEVQDMPKKKMENLNQEIADQNNQELSKEAMENLQNENPFDALKNQQQLSENMKSNLNQLQQMQQQMQQQSQQMVMQNMLKAIDNIIGLSKDQEKLNGETEKLRSQPRELPKMAQSQMEIKQNLDNILKQLNQLSQKTFAISPEMGEALGKAKNNMNKSIDGMQNRNGQQSMSNQGEAMSNLNGAASFLQNALQSMMQGGGQSGGGMMSLMQQLQQMAQQQMGLNKLTQMMKQGQLSMQQQAQMQRLAREQAAIQKSLNDLNREAREAGESKKLATDLERILQDMNEVISGLNTQKVDDDLIKTQEKILSKLLDAQRSINERDFEKNRESLSGKLFDVKSPDQLLLNTEIAKDLLREELLKSIKEGYTKDYEELIRRYFESLNQSSINN